MVEELKLAIKIDDATIEQLLLKQFANAQKMADKVVLDFKNVNFDDKQIEAKFKEMQKKAGQNPIDLTIGGNTLDMLGQIDKRLTEIFSIGKGKSFIDSSSTVADIGKIENKINELDKKYEEAQKKLSSIGSGGISGKDVNLVDNKEFQKLSDNFEKIKGEIDELKQKINTIDIDTEWLNNFTTGLDEELTDTQAKLDNFINDFNSSFEKINTSTSNTLFNEESIRIFEKLLTSIESSLSSIKGILVDVGDGEELSPLLREINNIQTAIGGLSSSLNNLHFNMNIDMGTDNQMDAKIQEKAAKALNAYEKLFNGLKMSGYGGEVVNNKFFDFDINKFDTTIGKVKAYKDIIERLRKEAKEYYDGTDLLRTQTDDKLWRSASSAGGQLTQAINETTKNKTDNPLTELFGKTDLSGVIEQLNTIVSKLDEISVSAKGFTETFKNGLNVNTSVEEIEKLTNRVKELETELAKIKTPTTVTAPQESNISSEVSAFQQQEKIQNQVTQSIQEQNKAIDESIKKTLTLNDVRQKQWEIIQKTNPKEEGTNSTWVDKPEDAKTFYEVNHKDSDYPFNENYSDDWTVKDKMNVEATGKITVYSSYPIEDGNWVTPSKEEGLSYAGSGKLYSATMDPRDIAWVDAGQGQVAHISDELKEVIDLSTKAETQVQSIDNNTNKTGEQSTLNALDDTIAKYETIVSLVKEYYDLSNNKKDTIGISSDDERISEIRKQLKSYTKNPDYNGEYKMGFGGSGKNIFAKSVDLSQEEMLQEICNMLGVEIPKNADKAKEAIKEVDSATATTEQKKDAFPKTSENLEQVAQSEQKVQQEAVATDKTLNNISFTPNTEGFEDIITKFGILREQAEQITKIVKTTKQTADGTPNISYKATLKNGSSYYLGENSTPQVLNASETVYDAKADNTKKLEREKQIWNELTTSLDRYATLQKRITSNNALSTDNEEATKLLEHIHELQRNDVLPTEKLTASNEKLQQINQTVTDLKAKLKESTLDSLQGSIDKYQKIYDQRKTYSSDFTPSEQYTKNLTELDTAIGNLVEYRNTLKNVSEVTVKQEAELKGLVTACEKASDSFKSLSASEKGASQIAIDKLVQRINKDLDECTNYSKEAKLGLRALRDELESANPRNLKEITSEIINIENAEIRAGRAGRSFFDTLKNSGFHQIAAQMAGMFGLYDVINIGRQAISTIVDLDDALLDLKKTTSMSSTELKNFYYSANDVAKQMGVTTKSIIEQASAWSRLGYSSNEQATEMAKLSSKFASISPGMDTDQAQEGMVSIMKAWQINPEDVEKEILDPINQLGNKFAESNDDIVEGMKRSAAALAAVGTDYKDAYSLFTGVQEVLQNSEVAGRALRSISMRIRGYDENSEDGFEQTDDELKNITGDLIDLTKTAQHAQGVSIFKEGSTTEFKSLVDYFGEIHDIWDEMSQKQQNDFLQKAFGKTQAQAGAALIQNYDAVKEALAEIDKSAGSADKEMSTVEQTLSYKINALKETWVGCAQQILDRGDLGIAISGLNGVSKVITGLIDNVGLLKTAAMGVAATLSFKNVGGNKMHFPMNILDNIHNLLWIQRFRVCYP